MNNLYIFLLCVLPLNSFCQSEKKRYSVGDDFFRLYRSGKLDSINLVITHFRDYYDIIDSMKQFYVRTECQAGGPNPVCYNYKVGSWNYWYENGMLMASGIYEPVRKGFKTSCSSDTVFSSLVTPKWAFYDFSGNRQSFRFDLAQKINQWY